MVLAGDKWRAIKCERHVPVVGPRRKMSRASEGAAAFELVSVQHDHVEPVAVVGIAVREQAAPVRGRQLAVSQLEPGVDVLYLGCRRQPLLRRLVSFPLWR